MEKFTFTTDFETVSENLGISPARHKEFFEAAKEASMRAILIDKSITDKSQAMEIYLNEVQPINKVEAFWSGCVFFEVFSQTEKIARQLNNTLEALAQ